MSNLILDRNEYYTNLELLEIYKRVQKRDLDALLAVAEELYPGRRYRGKQPLYIQDGAGRLHGAKAPPRCARPELSRSLQFQLPARDHPLDKNTDMDILEAKGCVFYGMQSEQNIITGPAKKASGRKNRREMEDEIGMLILLGIGLLCVVPMLLLVL